MATPSEISVVTPNGEVIEGTALEPYQPPAPPSLFGTTNPVEVVQRAASVADALKDVIVQRHLFEMIQGKPHIKVEGWQLLGSMLGVTAVCVATEQIETGWKATVEARTADGRIIGRADALCTSDETRGPWKNADEYARLSMAQTRATSKALKGPLGFVISMAGYATTPAEEMTFAEPEPPQQRKRRTSAKPKAISEERYQQLLALHQQSGLDGTWLRMHLIELGVEDLPDEPGALSRAVHSLAAEQADKLEERYGQHAAAAGDFD